MKARELRAYTFQGTAYYCSGKLGDEHRLHPTSTIMTVLAPNLRVARQFAARVCTTLKRVRP